MKSSCRIVATYITPLQGWELSYANFAAAVIQGMWHLGQALGPIKNYNNQKKNKTKKQAYKTQVQAKACKANGCAKAGEGLPYRKVEKR